jgi:hypothetical protein
MHAMLDRVMASMDRHGLGDAVLTTLPSLNLKLRGYGGNPSHFIRARISLPGVAKITPRPRIPLCERQVTPDQRAEILNWSMDFCLGHPNAPTELIVCVAKSPIRLPRATAMTVLSAQATETDPIANTLTIESNGPDAEFRQVQLHFEDGYLAASDWTGRRRRLRLGRQPPIHDRPPHPSPAAARPQPVDRGVGSSSQIQQWAVWQRPSFSCSSGFF